MQQSLPIKSTHHSPISIKIITQSYYYLSRGYDKSIRELCYFIKLILDSEKSRYLYNPYSSEYTVQNYNLLLAHLLIRQKKKLWNGLIKDWLILDSDKTMCRKIKCKDSEPWGRSLIIAALEDVLYKDYYTDTKCL